MDDTTFGNSPAAIVLAKILSKEENSKWKKRVTNLLIRLNHTLKELNKADARTATHLSKLYFDYHKKFFYDLPEGEIQNFSLNVAYSKIGVFRELLKKRKKEEFQENIKNGK